MTPALMAAILRTINTCTGYEEQNDEMERREIGEEFLTSNDEIFSSNGYNYNQDGSHRYTLQTTL